MNEIMASLFFSLLGFVYFRYAKNNGDTPMVVVGVILMAYPYFISGLFTIVFVGVVLMIVPFVLKKLLLG